MDLLWSRCWAGGGGANERASFLIDTLIFAETLKQGFDVSKTTDRDPDSHSGKKGDRTKKEYCPKRFPHIHFVWIKELSFDWFG
jgi:hypothetical protein